MLSDEELNSNKGAVGIRRTSEHGLLATGTVIQSRSDGQLWVRA